LSIRFQADNDLTFAIVKAVRRREPAIDFASAQQSELGGVSDPEVLEQAARNNRVLVSHDMHTMISHFRDRLAAGRNSPGLLMVSQKAVAAEVVEAVLFLWSVTDPADLHNQVYYLPSLVQHVFTR